MHAAARGFLMAHRLIGGGAGIDPACVYFELTKEAKVARAAQLGCDMFIDDLPEILALPGFPEGMCKILFDPDGQFAGRSDAAAKFERRTSWAAISADLVREPA